MVVRAGHSRVPVFEDNLDNIVGILYAKDLLPYLKHERRRQRGDRHPEIVRQPVYVRRSKPVDELLHEMQAAKRHIAIVVDEYGGTAGLVTMEDVVEEIVGEIQDEYDTRGVLVEPIEADGELASASTAASAWTTCATCSTCPTTRSPMRRPTTRSGARHPPHGPHPAPGGDHFHDVKLAGRGGRFASRREGDRWSAPRRRGAGTRAGIEAGG